MENHKKPIALAFSDLHINMWNHFNEDNQRTLNQFRVLHILKEKCIEYNIPALFLGDLFHTPLNIDNELLNLTIHKFNIFKDWKCYCISGNHDMKFMNSFTKPSISWLNSFPSLINLDFKSIEFKSVVIYGIPYINNNIGLDRYLFKLIKNLDKSKKNILLMHSDFPGAEDTNGSKLNSSDFNIKLLEKFNLVLMGHIHKPQKLSKNIIMVGAPIQQRRTDRNCSMGYWIIYNDLTTEFINLSNKFPKFIDVESQEMINDDGNYYTIIGKGNIEINNEDNNLNKGLTKKTLIRRYLKLIGEKDKEKKNILIKYLND